MWFCRTNWSVRLVFSWASQSGRLAEAASAFQKLFLLWWLRLVVFSCLGRLRHGVVCLQRTVGFFGCLWVVEMPKFSENLANPYLPCKGHAWKLPDSFPMAFQWRQRLSHWVPVVSYLSLQLSESTAHIGYCGIHGQATGMKGEGNWNDLIDR